MTWFIYRHGRGAPVGHDRRTTAINAANREFRGGGHGVVTVKNSRDGEVWERRAGSWFKRRAGRGSNKAGAS